MLTIQLDTVVKRRNASEWRDVNRAKCGDMEEVGDHRVIVALSRRLLDRYPPETMVEVRRGDLLCFRGQMLSVWAAGKVGVGKQPEHLRRAQEGPQRPKNGGL